LEALDFSYGVLCGGIGRHGDMVHSIIPSTFKSCRCTALIFGAITHQLKLGERQTLRRKDMCQLFGAKHQTTHAPKKNKTTMTSANITHHPMRLLTLLFLLLSSPQITHATSIALPRGGAIQPTAPNNPLQTFLTTISSARSHLAAAACARATSIFAMYPVDTVKTRMQIGNSEAFRWNGLYRGVWGSLMGQVPYG
jgi:hypothetical protein